jgi:hypothetical protein
MATSYNISTYQGDFLQATLAVKDTNNNPINLNGYAIRGQVRASYGSTGVLLDLNPTITNYVSGLINISIPSDVTDEIPVGQFVYDIERYPSGLVTGNSIKLMVGKFIVSPEVTR